MIRRKKTTVKSGGFEVRRKPGESTVILESSPANENTLMGGGKLFHQKKLSVGNMSVLESLKNLSSSFELGLSSQKKSKAGAGVKMGLSSTARLPHK